MCKRRAVIPAQMANPPVVQVVHWPEERPDIPELDGCNAECMTTGRHDARHFLGKPLIIGQMLDDGIGHHGIYCRIVHGQVERGTDDGQNPALKPQPADESSPAASPAIASASPPHT